MATFSADISSNTSLSCSIDRVSYRIKAIRQQKKISQTDFAQRLGIERSNYHRLEKRGQKLTLEQLTSIAQALDVPVVELIYDELVTTQQQEHIIQQQQERLVDKQLLLDSYGQARRALIEQIELNLNRVAKIVQLDKLSPRGEVMGSLVTGQLARAALAEFPGRAETCWLFDKPYKGLQLVYLALHLSITEPGFFNVIIRLVDLQFLDRTSLYVRAFFYISQTSDVYAGVLEETLQARRQCEEDDQATSKQ